MKVIKRDGRKQNFNSQKIINAVQSAFQKVDGEITDFATNKAKEIAKYVESLDRTMTVEEIQDIVENKLMSSSRKDVAKEYILYREERTKARELQTQFFQNVTKKIKADDVQNQNANVDEKSFGGRKGEADAELMKKYALDYLMSEKARTNHLGNRIYTHDLDSYAVGMHNCCDRNTQFITKNGVYSFNDFEDGDLIEVLTHDGSWQSAVVHSYGTQRLNKITFARSGQRYVEEYFTSNHRWLLANGETTTSLKVGDVIMKAPQLPKFDFDNATLTEQYYWCLGFVLGDGTNACRWSHGKKDESVKFVRLRLCGEKTQYHERFNDLKHSTKVMDNGDLYLTFSSVIGFVKEFPDLEKMTWYEKLALFDGLYCADGQQKGHRKSLFTSNEQIASFIEDVAPSLGYYIVGINDYSGEKTNYGIRDFAKEFIFVGDNNKYYWTVIDIEPYKNDTVWCLDVLHNHSFVLPNGIVTGNCLTIPFDDLLKNGFNTRQTDVRPANSVSTALQLVAVIIQIQSLQQFGGVSASHLDWTLVPYVRKSFSKHMKDGLKYIENIDDEEYINSVPNELAFDDEEANAECHKKAYEYAMDMTKKEIYQAVEGMFHNLNTLQSRSGNQLPFSSINYGTCTLEEGRLITKAILDTSIKGIGKNHRTSVFPCQIFQVMKGVNKEPNAPNYDLYKLALESTAKRLYPNYANVDWSTNKGFDINNPDTYVSTMGCRTYNGFDMNGFGQMKDGRGNIAPVTIILPTIAMESVELADNFTEEYQNEHPNLEVEIFLQKLDEAINDAKDILIERYQYICSQSPDSAKFMYENGTMRGYIPEEGIRSALKHGTLAIGQIGLAETLQILIGCNQTTDKGLELGKQIEKMFNEKCAEFKHELHRDEDGYEYYLNFGVYLTPAENLCYTSMNKFKAKYGEIPNVSDREYFTNSTHVPVWEKIDPFTKIRIEAELDKYSNAGCITYVEFESSIQNNLEALETVVNYAMDCDLPYFAVNVPNDQCQDCGYTNMIDKACPICGGTDIRRLRRVTGYLTGDYNTAFNKGKQAEVEDRYQHSKQMRWEKQYTF